MSVYRIFLSFHHINAIYSDLEPAVAKQLALGRLDPITLLPMDDINPSYSPKRAKELSLQTLNKGKGKAKEASGGIRDFFGRH